MNNFHRQPVGRAVLYLNEFHHGRRLSDLNRAALYVPEMVKGYAGLISDTPHATPESVDTLINVLLQMADDMSNIDE